MGLSRRQFLASSALAGLFAAGSPLSAKANTAWYNWSGSLNCLPQSRWVPRDEAELIQLLKSSKESVRPVGAGHSFSPLVPTDGHLVVLDHFTGMKSHDAERMRATFGAGMRLADTGDPLHQIGQAMINLPDIDRQTLAGAVATATHGTGLSLGGLSDYVTQMRMVTATGDVLDIDEQHEYYDAARVSVGALGIMTEMTFQNRKPYKLKARNRVAKVEDALARFDAEASNNRHHELFPLLYSSYTIELTIDETDEAIAPIPEDPEGEQALVDLMNLVLATPAIARKTLVDSIMGESEPTFGVDQSYRILTNLRHNRFNEMEYSVPAKVGGECLMEILETVQSQSLDVVFPLEYRYVHRDDTWLGMHTGDEDHAAISIHQSANLDYREYFNAIEPIFWKYGGRPHWGKIHSLGKRQLMELYPRFDDFCRLREELDPQGRLLNEHLTKLFVG